MTSNLSESFESGAEEYPSIVPSFQVAKADDFEVSGAQAVAAEDSLISAPVQNSTQGEISTTLDKEDEVDEEAEVVKAKLRFWSTVRARLIFILVIFALVLMEIGIFASISIKESDGDIGIADPKSWIVHIYGTLSGRITPAATLTCVITLFAGCATITVALAVGRAPNLGIREQAVYSQWRVMLEGIAFLAAVGALLLAFAAWTGTEIRATSGLSVATDIFAILCILMVLSIAGEQAEADRLLRKWFEKQRSRRLAARKVRIGSVIETIPTKSVKMTIGACLTRSLLVGGAFAILVQASVIVLRVMRDQDVALGFENLVGLAILITFGAVNVFLCGYYSVIRWSTYNIKHVNWQLTGKTAVLRIGGSLLTLLSIFLVVRDGVIYTLISFYFLGPALFVWGAISLTRNGYRPGWLTWLTSPVWEAVARVLGDGMSERVKPLNESESTD
ncbi:hypothetical protein EU244_030505 [Rhodococcus qingshengii]|uniref:hypothetical protein n=1 Tax=Rhodococcus qingshengii TaxID=334542 RepID=UPI0010A64D3E|nr:hypothetical protein [Rhodococcus qingshengii]THJ67651.1 hypothetical protein EU244_26000 [Rhodococcus qingshengii]